MDVNRLDASLQYRKEVFYQIFPKTVHKGSNQSSTLSWIYNRCADGKNNVTPRDVIELLSGARQYQYDECKSNRKGASAFIVGPAALRYGLEELSKRKRQTYLEAEFPHLWKHIEKFVGGKTEYDESSMRRILGSNWKLVVDDLISIGLLSRKISKKKTKYWVPFLYRDALELKQGMG